MTLPSRIYLWLGMLLMSFSLPAAAEVSWVAEVMGWVGELFDWLQQAHPAQLIGVLFVAPLFGVPLSVLLVIVGLTLPPPLALLVVTSVLCVHHLLLFMLSRTFAGDWLRRELSKRRCLPRGRGFGGDVLFLLTAAWAPGLSYIFKLAFVALADLPSRTYFVFGVLSQLTVAVPYILLGEVAQEAGFGWLSAAVFMILIALWALRYFISRRLSS